MALSVWERQCYLLELKIRGCQRDLVAAQAIADHPCVKGDPHMAQRAGNIIRVIQLTIDDLTNRLLEAKKKLEATRR